MRKRDKVRLRDDLCRLSFLCHEWGLWIKEIKKYKKILIDQSINMSIERNSLIKMASALITVARRMLLLATYTESSKNRVKNKYYFRVYHILRFYLRFVHIFQAVQKYEGPDPNQRRTHFVCFEDLSHPSTQNRTLRRIIQWLYPGGQYDHIMPPPPKITITAW